MGSHVTGQALLAKLPADAARASSTPKQQHFVFSCGLAQHLSLSPDTAGELAASVL